MTSATTTPSSSSLRTSFRPILAYSVLVVAGLVAVSQMGAWRGDGSFLLPRETKVARQDSNDYTNQSSVLPSIPSTTGTTDSREITESKETITDSNHTDVVSSGTTTTTRSNENNGTMNTKLSRMASVPSIANTSVDRAVYLRAYVEQRTRSANDRRHRNQVAQSLLRRPERLVLPPDLQTTAVDPWTRGGRHHYNTTILPDPACERVLYDRAWFEQLGGVYVRHWMARHPHGYEWPSVYEWRRGEVEPPSVNVSEWRPDPPTAAALNDAQDAWLQALHACRGPLPLQSPGLEIKALSGLTFFEQFFYSTNVQGNRKLNQFRFDSLYEKFQIAASCLLHLQLPFTPQPFVTGPGRWWNEPLRVVAPAWRPQRVLFLTVNTYRRPLRHQRNMSLTDLAAERIRAVCPFLQTAYERGYEVWVATGPVHWFMLTDKFRYSLLLMEAALKAKPEIRPEDTLVVFGDGSDVLTQFGANYVVERFLDQAKPFVWAGGDCTPLSQPVFTPGGKGDNWLCNHGDFFPHQHEGGGFHARDSVQINSGQWIGIFPAARQLLGDIVTFLDHNDAREWRNFTDGLPLNQHCSYGYDQLFGQVAYLRHRDCIGHDTQAVLFGALGDPVLRDTVSVCGPEAFDPVDEDDSNNSNNQESAAPRARICYGKTTAALREYKCNATNSHDYQCPAMVHLVGDGKQLLAELAPQLLTADEQTGQRTACRKGSLHFVDVESKQVFGSDEMEARIGVPFPCFEPHFCSSTTL